MGRNNIHPLNGMRKRGSFKTLKPMLHTPKRTSRWVHFFFFLVCWQICWFYVLLRAWWWDIVILLLFVLVRILNIVWFAWKSLCDHVVFFVLGHFWIVELFDMKLGQCWWLMKLGNVCSLWYCWMNFDSNVVDIGILRTWCVGLIDQTHFWWVWNFVGMCKSYFISMEIFMGMEKIVVVMWVFFLVGHERFLGFLAWKILVASS